MKLRVCGIRGWILLAAAGVLWSQEPADPPARVARLGAMDGSVSVRPAGVDEWAPATLNFPLTTGDRLWTDADSHADLHSGTTAIHMAPETALGILHLSDRVMQLSLSEGTINLRIPRMDDDEVYEVDTPAGAITVRRVGRYRIDVLPDGDVTMLTVRSGEAELTAGGQTFPVREGQMLRVFAGEPLISDFLDAPEPDPWDEWCMSEDELAERSMQSSETYVPAEMTGMEDLSLYGDWSTDTDYGVVWTPRDVPVDWAPYRFGCWVYRAPWGWTWIDDARWGFAPFHYGRWVLIGTTWVWVPGPRIVRPVWAPALVVFVNVPGRPQVGWVPLGPHEPFRPPYRSSAAYLQRVNPGITNAGQAPPEYVNRRRMTAVSREILVAGRPVGPARVRSAERDLASARPTNSPEVQPGRESFLGRRPGASIRVLQPPEAVSERPVITRREPPASARPPATGAGTDAGPRSGRPARMEEQSRPPDSQRLQEQLQRAIDARRQEQPRVSEQQQRIPEQQRAEEARRGEEQRRAEEARQAESQRRLEQSRRAEEQRRQDEQRRAEAARQAESQRREESRRAADEQRRQDEQRRADEAQRQEEQRRAEEARRADSQRRQEEFRRAAEEQRRADEQRRQEDQRRQEEQRRADEQRRQQDEQRRQEDQRRQEEQRRADEQRRQQDEQRRQEDQRRQEEQRRQDDAARKKQF